MASMEAHWIFWMPLAWQERKCVTVDGMVFETKETSLKLAMAGSQRHHNFIERHPGSMTFNGQIWSNDSFGLKMRPPH